MTKSSRKSRPRDQVVRLEDLTPREDIIGGSGRTVFGQTTVRTPAKPDPGGKPPRPVEDREPTG